MTQLQFHTLYVRHTLVDQLLNKVSAKCVFIRARVQGWRGSALSDAV